MDASTIDRTAVRRALRALTSGAAGLALALAFALGPSAPASATAPGANGRIVFAADLTGTWQIFSMSPNGLHVRQLTHLPDTGFTDLMPGVSADGTRVVYSSDQGGEAELYTMNLDGSDVSQLTDDPDNYDTAPSWSPDGTEVVFARCDDAGCRIAEVGADGTGLHDLSAVRLDFAPVFTPDGSRIVFESQRRGLISALWVMDADGSHAHRLTPSRLRAGGADVSPNGQRVVFFSNENYPNPQALWEIGLDGSGLHRLTRSRLGHSDLWPSYSPDGRFVTFASNRAYPGLCCMDVWRVNVDGSGLVPLTSNLAPDGCENGNCVYPAWGVKPTG
jgi:Tol biopolymer transport system component